jgi:hypothetical protein
VGFVADKSDDHAVEVEEEHEQVETQLDEGFLSSVSVLLIRARSTVCEQRHIVAVDWLRRSASNLLVHVQFSEDLRRIQEVLVLEDSAMVSIGCQVALLAEFARTSCRSMPTRAGSKSAQPSIH